MLWIEGDATSKDDTQKEPQYVYVCNHVVHRVKAKTVNNFLKRWCEHEGLEEELINKLMAMKSALPSNTISHLWERDDLDFTNCSATSQTLYFRNAIVEVTADKISRQPSGVGNGHYVWEEAIIQHDYCDMKPMFSVTKGDDDRYHIAIDPKAKSNLLRFLVNSSRLFWRKSDEFGQELTDEEIAEEEQCLITKILNLGYMLHRYKSSSEARATLCLDAAMTDSDDDANGRSGKSFYISAITELVRFFEIDGRTMDSKTNMQFIYAGLDESMALIKVDECKKDFNFEYFFGQITNNITVEKKGKDPIIIPFSKAPKFIFGSNYVLKKHDPSRDARLWPVLFSDYYHQRSKNNDYREDRSIHSDFGKDLMREDYSEQEWQADIHLMLECLQLYLSLPVGERQIMPPMNRIERREQMAAVGKDFKQWADDYFAEGSGHLDCDLKAESVLADFNQETRFAWPPKKMTQHLNAYCLLADHLHCLNPVAITHKNKDGERWIKRDENGQQKAYYYVMSAKTAAEAQKKEPVQTDLTFDDNAAEPWPDGKPF